MWTRTCDPKIKWAGPQVRGMMMVDPEGWRWVDDTVERDRVVNVVDDIANLNGGRWVRLLVFSNLASRERLVKSRVVQPTPEHESEFVISYSRALALTTADMKLTCSCLLSANPTSLSIFSISAAE